MQRAIRSVLTILKIRGHPVRAVSFLLVASLVSASIVAAARMKIGSGSFGVDHERAYAVPGQRRVQVVSFTLYDVGIYPQEARANPGLIGSSIEDLTGSSSGLIVDRVDETARMRSGVLNKPTNRLRLRAELHLPAGRYELVDATHPGNRAVLIVEP